MLVSISGRTDIVNYYSDWMFNRFEEGFVYSRNSLFPNSVRRYELTPDKVDCIVFGSKNYSPVLSRIHEVVDRFPTYFGYTITAYEKDVEPGVAAHDDRALLEMLILECFQAGLSWECVLNKREAFHEAFDSFDLDKLCYFDQAKVESLMQEKRIIRNRRKIDAAIINAFAFAVRTGSTIFGEDETVIKIASVVSRNRNEIIEYPESDTFRRSVPVDAYMADVAMQWIELNPS